MVAPTTFGQTAQWSLQFQPFADQIYDAIFPLSRIQRFYNPPTIQTPAERFLDQQCCVDGFIERHNGMKHFFQEKFHATNFDTITIEYDGGKGEWGRNMAQLHCEGYGDPAKGFHTFYILSLFDLYEAVAEERLVGVKQQNNRLSQADFWAFQIRDVRAAIPHAFRYILS